MGTLASSGTAHAAQVALLVIGGVVLLVVVGGIVAAVVGDAWNNYKDDLPGCAAVALVVLIIGTLIGLAFSG